MRFEPHKKKEREIYIPRAFLTNRAGGQHNRQVLVHADPSSRLRKPVCGQDGENFVLSYLAMVAGFERPLLHFFTWEE